MEKINADDTIKDKTSVLGVTYLIAGENEKISKPWKNVSLCKINLGLLKQKNKELLIFASIFREKYFSGFWVHEFKS